MRWKQKDCIMLVGCESDCVLRRCFGSTVYIELNIAPTASATQNRKARKVKTFVNF